MLSDRFSLFIIRFLIYFLLLLNKNPIMQDATQCSSSSFANDFIHYVLTAVHDASSCFHSIFLSFSLTLSICLFINGQRFLISKVSLSSDSILKNLLRRQHLDVINSFRCTKDVVTSEGPYKLNEGMWQFALTSASKN